MLGFDSLIKILLAMKISKVACSMYALAMINLVCYRKLYARKAMKACERFDAACEQLLSLDFSVGALVARTCRRHVAIRKSQQWHTTFQNYVQEQVCSFQVLLKLVGPDFSDSRFVFQAGLRCQWELAMSTGMEQICPNTKKQLVCTARHTPSRTLGFARR